MTRTTLRTLLVGAVAVTVCSIVALVALTLFVANSDDPGTPAPEEASPSSTPPAAEPEPEPEVVEETYLSDDTVESTFANLLRDEYPGDFMGSPDRLLVDAAKASCEAFDAGLGFADVILVATESGISYEGAGAIVGAGVAAFCPEHAHLFTD